MLRWSVAPELHAARDDQASIVPDFEPRLQPARGGDAPAGTVANQPQVDAAHGAARAVAQTQSDDIRRSAVIARDVRFARRGGALLGRDTGFADIDEGHPKPPLHP